MPTIRSFIGRRVGRRELCRLWNERGPTSRHSYLKPHSTKRVTAGRKAGLMGPIRRVYRYHLGQKRHAAASATHFSTRAPGAVCRDYFSAEKDYPMAPRERLRNRRASEPSSLLAGLGYTCTVRRYAKVGADLHRMREQYASCAELAASALNPLSDHNAELP